MLFVAVAVVASLMVAGLVMLYVAYPHRGEDVPGLPWLGRAMGRAAAAVPVISDDERELARLR